MPMWEHGKTILKLNWKSILDNYANYYGYGLYRHDDRNAILHTLFMLVQLKKQDVLIEQEKFRIYRNK